MTPSDEREVLLRMLPDDPDRLAAGGQGGVGDGAHQPDERASGGGQEGPRQAP